MTLMVPQGCHNDDASDDSEPVGGTQLNVCKVVSCLKEGQCDFKADSSDVNTLWADRWEQMN